MGNCQEFYAAAKGFLNKQTKYFLCKFPSLFRKSNPPSSPPRFSLRLKNYGEKFKVFHTAVDKCVAFPFGAVVAVARRELFLAALVRTFARARKNVNYFAVALVLVVANALTRLERAAHNFSCAVCKHFHEEVAFAALELRERLSFNFIKINFHIFSP
jgi:hypothetical protein